MNLVSFDRLPAGRGTVVACLAFSLSAAACSDGPGTNTDDGGGDGAVDDVGDAPDDDGTREDGDDGDGDAGETYRPVPPALAPCPAGWEEVPPSEPGGVTTCEPWPDGDPAAPPAWSPCPTGWREAIDPATGTTTCDPWPAAGPATCAAEDEAHFPGETGCSRIGTACGVDSWAADLPTDRPVLYVLAGAPAGGDGTRGAPFATVAEATAAAAAGDVVALSRGTFDEAVVLPAGVTLWGACVSETLVTCSVASETDGTIAAGGAGGTVRNLRLGGDRAGVRADGATASVTLRDVLIAGTAKVALWFTTGAAVTGRTIVVRDTRSSPTAGNAGRGLEVTGGGSSEVSRAVFERNHDVGVSVLDAGTMLRLVDVAVRDTQGREADATGGWGLQVIEGGSAELRRTAFEANRDVAVVVLGPGVALRASDLVVRDTRGRESDGRCGWGLDAATGALVELERAVFERNRDVGIVGTDAGTMVRLTDVVIRDTSSRSTDGLFGRALNIQDAAAAELSRCAFERNHDLGLCALDAGTTLRAVDLIVRDTSGRDADLDGGWALVTQDGAATDVERGVFERSHDGGLAVRGADALLRLTDVIVRDTEGRASDGEYGTGLVVEDGAGAEVARGLFERSRDHGVTVRDAGTTLRLADVVVRDTLGAESDGRSGNGLVVEGGGAAQVDRGLFERNRDVALSSFNGAASLRLTDVVVRDSLGQGGDGRFGRGLEVLGDATAEVTRGLFERNRDVAIYCQEPDSSIVLFDVTVRDTLAQECEASTCPEQQTGIGIGVYRMGGIEASSILVTNNARCGLQLAFGFGVTGDHYLIGGTMDLHGGEVSGHSVCGANVQTASFDLSRLMDGVVFRDNALDFDTSARYEPEASASTH